MQDLKKPETKAIRLSIWRVYLLLVILLSSIALISEIQRISPIRQDSLNKLSFSQFFFIIVVVLAICSSGLLLFQAWRHPKRVKQRLDQITLVLDRPKMLARIFLIVSVIFLLGCFIITLTPEITEPTTLGIYEKLLPVLFWITVLSAQTLVFLAFIGNRLDLSQLFSKGKALFITLATLGLIYLGWSWVSDTTFILLEESNGWNLPGVPILETQLLIAWLVGMTMFLFMVITPNLGIRSTWLQKLNPQKVDLLIGVLLWIVTIFLWRGTALVPSWFVSEPRPPNFEYYPSSDAFAYNRTSQAHLVGEGFRDFRPGEYFNRRILLAVFQSIYHLIGGQNYESVVSVQIVVLALLPALIFFLTKSIHNRISGVIVALLIMSREVNSIAISDRITASHAKLLMSDLPTQLLMVCLTICAIAWIKRIDRMTVYALICGGFLGLISLIRTEVILLFFPLVAISGVVLLPQKLFLQWIKNSLFLILGVVLILAPWLWRTWNITGSFSIDSPDFYLRFFKNRSQPLSSTVPSQFIIGADSLLSGGTPSTSLLDDRDNYITNNILVNHLSGVTKNVVVITSYFLNSQVQTNLIPPTTLRAVDSFTAFIFHKDLDKFLDECCSLENYVRRMPYWHKWDGKFLGQSTIPLILILLTFATGISVAWKRQSLIGLIPLILSTSYILIHALLRNSGGRFILPADWTSLVYFSIGLAFISTYTIKLTTHVRYKHSFHHPDDQPEPPIQQDSMASYRKFYVTIFLLFLVGCSIPLFEISIPQRYTQVRNSALLNALMRSERLEESTRQNLIDFLGQGGVTITGRGLYPRFFPANHAGPGDFRGAFGVKPFPRISFYITGPQSNTIVLPFTSETFSFPNASDVIVFACSNETISNERGILAVAVFDQTGEFETLLLRSPMPVSLVCPFPDMVSSS